MQPPHAGVFPPGFRAVVGCWTTVFIYLPTPEMRFLASHVQFPTSHVSCLREAQRPKGAIGDSGPMAPLALGYPEPRVPCLENRPEGLLSAAPLALGYPKPRVASLENRPEGLLSAAPLALGYPEPRVARLENRR